jgi:hypothetical protein
MVTAAGPAGPLTAYEGNDMMEAALMGPGKTGFFSTDAKQTHKALSGVFFTLSFFSSF